MLISWKTVRDLILSDLAGKSEGAELDSDREYAARALASLSTVKKAMTDLASRGLVRRSRGRRTVALTRPPIVSASAFSFRRSALKIHGYDVTTKILEQTCRLPNPGDYVEYERRAQLALGLKRDQRFVVISRKRIFSGEARAIHRSYLNPEHFPSTFLADHDFEATSLLEILTSHGLQSQSRQTRICADLPKGEEVHIFQIDGEPVLNVEQSLFAIREKTRERVTAEYLHATYCRWEYVVDDRV